MGIDTTANNSPLSTPLRGVDGDEPFIESGRAVETDGSFPTVTSPSPIDLQQFKLALFDEIDQEADKLTRTPRQFASRSRYRLIRLIGKGGLGQVYRALDKKLDRQVAVKISKSASNWTHHDEDRFFREYRLTARLQHPGIPAVFSAGRLSNGKRFYAMRLVEGQPLSEMIRSHHQVAISDVNARKESLIRLLGHFKAVCDTVHAAHECGVVHLDLKPENVMVEPSGATFVVDWGLAQHIPSGPLSNAGRPILDADDPRPVGRPSAGTPEYMAPEQILGDRRSIDAKTDIFALGGLLHAILTGAPPRQQNSAVPGRTRFFSLIRRDAFQGESQTIDRDRLSSSLPELRSICLRALEHQQADRYPSAQALGSDVTNWIRGDTVVAHRGEYSWSQLVGRVLVRHQKIAGIALLSTIIVVLAIVTAAVQMWTAAGRVQVALVKQQQTNSQLFTALEQLTESVMTDSILSSPLLSEVREDLLTQLGAQYLLWSNQAEGTISEKIRAGRGLSAVANIEMQTGKLSRALDSAELSLRLWREVVREDESLEAIQGLLNGLRQRAELLMSNDQLPEAEQACSECRELLSHSRQQMSSAEALIEEAKLSETLVSLEYSQAERQPTPDLRTRHMLLARGHAQRAVDLRRQLTNNNSTATARLDLAGGLSRLALTTQKSVSASEAVGIYHSALQTLSEAAARQPDAKMLSQIESLRVTVLFNQIMAFNGAADYSSARAAAREGISIAARLDRQFPLMIRYRQELARGWGNLAATLVSIHNLTKSPEDLEELLTAQGEASSTYLKLSDELPDRGYQGAGAIHLMRRGLTLHQRTTRHEEALAAYRKCFELVPNILDMEPTNAGNWHCIAVGYALMINDQAGTSEDTRAEYSKRLAELAPRLVAPALTDRLLRSQILSDPAFQAVSHIDPVTEMLAQLRKITDTL